MRTSCILLFQVVFLLCSIKTFAQQNFPKNELESSYGIFPVMEIKKITGNFYEGSIDAKPVEKITGTGSLTLSYNRALKKRFYTGVSLFYDKAVITYSNSPDTRNWYVYGVLLNTKYNYVFDPRFHMYSGLSVGYAGNISKKGDKKDHHSTVAFQARLVGLRFGAKVGVFSELGFGYEGILKAGLSVHF